MPEIPFSFFLKELPDSPLYLPSGQRVAWERIDSEVGVLATQDANMIFQLSNAADKRRGGVVKIDQARYEELIKKKLGGNSNLPQPVRSSLPQAPIRVGQSPVPVAQPMLNLPGNAVVAEAKVEPPPPQPQVVPQQTVRRGKLHQ